MAYAATWTLAQFLLTHVHPTKRDQRSGSVSYFSKSVLLFAVGAGLAAPSLAQTALTTTQNFTGGQTTVTQTQSRTGPGTASFPGTTSASSNTLVPLSKFDTSTGILVGARVSVNIPYSVSLAVTGPGSGSRTVDASSTVSTSVTFAGGTLSSPTFALTEGCNGGDCANASGNNTITRTGTLAGSVAASAAGLAGLVTGSPGTLSFATQVNAANTSITATGAGLTSARATTTAVVGNTSNSYTLAYDYLKFATPSFRGTSIVTSDTLDFGTISNRAGPVSLSVSLFNIGDINTAGLELYQITGPGNPLFSTTASPFLNLAANGSTSFSVTLNPLSLGVASGVYRFFLRDYAPGGVGIRNYELTLNVLGNVFDPVPEPGTWMTMLLGFGMVGVIARRRGTVCA